MLWFCLACAASAAAGPARERVVLVSLLPDLSQQAWVEAERWTRDELTQLGLDVVVVSGATLEVSARKYELLQAAEAHQALAALRIWGNPAVEVDIELWVTDGDTGKLRQRVFAAAEIPVVPDRASGAAFKAAEMLRAAAIEIGIEVPEARPHPQADLVPVGTGRRDSPKDGVAADPLDRRGAVQGRVAGIYAPGGMEAHDEHRSLSHATAARVVGRSTFSQTARVSEGQVVELDLTLVPNR